MDPVRVGSEHQQVGVLEGRLGRVRADRWRAADDVVTAGAGPPADQCVVAGLVLRNPDPHDGRACLLSPTELGVATLTTVRRARRDSLSQLLAAWTETDRDAFAALLARFTTDLDEAGTLNPTPTTGSPA